jgi:F-type H+-transporting ATPase subunit epsilon
MSFRLSVVTPARPLIDAEVEQMVAPGREGEFGVLPGHERFLAPLRPGVLRYTEQGNERRLAVSGGFAEVTADRVTVLASFAARPEDLDAAEVRRALELAESSLLELGVAAEPAEHEAAQQRVDVARAQLEVLA